MPNTARSASGGFVVLFGRADSDTAHRRGKPSTNGQAARHLGRRSDKPPATLSSRVLPQNLTHAEIDALAAYIKTLK
jgi:hypothetical protein